MRVAIIGYGKMGHEIESVLIARGHEVVLTIDHENQSELTAANLAGVDVAIEFSTPATAFDNIMRCLEAGAPIVSGTTAWLDRYDEVVAKCQTTNGSFFYASNYSIGVNLFFKMSQHLATMMNRFEQYDVTINEVHHTQKMDAPSGTAITLADGIIAECDRLSSWHLGAAGSVSNTSTTLSPNVRSELEITSQRRSVVPGTHTITWESDVDSITIDHQAKSRAGFAVGAVAAAEFLVDRKGVYTMSDLLGF